MTLYITSKPQLLPASKPIRQRRIKPSLSIVAMSILIFFMFFFVSCAESPEPVNISSLESEVRDLLTLSTYEYVYRDVIYLGEERSFIIFKTMDKRLLFSVDVIVRAGINLRKGFSVEEMPGKEPAIEITLPKAEIFSVDADERTIHQYFAKEMGGEISRLEYYEEIARKKDDINADAVKRGILAQAEKNGKKIINRLFSAAGINRITYRWIDSAEPEE